MLFSKTDYHVLDINLKRFSIWFRVSNTATADVEFPKGEIENGNNYIEYVDCDKPIFIVLFTVNEPLNFLFVVCYAICCNSVVACEIYAFSEAKCGLSIAI